MNRSAGATGSWSSRAWCGRVVLCCVTNASIAAWAASTDSNGPQSSSNSRRNVRWNRSIFPVVAGEAGWVSRWMIAFLRQIMLRRGRTARLSRRSAPACLPMGRGGSTSVSVLVSFSPVRRPGRPRRPGRGPSQGRCPPHTLERAPHTATDSRSRLSVVLALAFDGAHHQLGVLAPLVDDLLLQ